ncbi:FkbM family methyltransferase [Halorutilales archaeon Cl-col2-1]
MNTIKLVKKAQQIFQEEGLLSLISRTIYFIYARTFQNISPRKTTEYNGQQVRSIYLFDRYIPFAKADGERPNYESGIVQSIKNHSKNGDEVIIVGGGWGVTATVAAKNVGEDGDVMVYEGSASEIEKINDTTKLNNVEDSVAVKHAIVGPLVSLRGSANGAEKVAPQELPNCDILELDCEGSEIDILENMTITPRVIIVESHGMNGSSSDNVESLLQELSYKLYQKK